MSIVNKILARNWDNYQTDLHPKIRSMKILQDMRVRGMSSENVRFLINQLVRYIAKDGVYLEVGIYRGCSLLSAALFNPTTRCIGIDDFSLFNSVDNKNEKKLQKNLRKFINLSNVEYYKSDYRDAINLIFSKEPHLKVNVYYYDGSHEYEDQVTGLNVMLPHLASNCAIIVDDINLNCIEAANRDFIEKNPDFKSVLKIKTQGNASPDWWNGIEVITRGLET